MSQDDERSIKRRIWWIKERFCGVLKMENEVVKMCDLRSLSLSLSKYLR